MTKSSTFPPLNHQREDSGVDTAYLHDFLVKHEKSKKKSTLCCKVSKKKLCGLCCTFLFLLIIIVIVGVVASKNASTSAAQGPSLVDISPNSSFIATRAIVWPNSTLSASVSFYVLTNNTAIIRFDSLAPVPSVQLSSTPLTQIFQSISSNSVYVQDKLNGVLILSGNTLQPLFQTLSTLQQTQSLLNGLYYTTDSNSINLFISGSTSSVVVYQSTVAFRFFYIASPNVFYTVMNDGIQEITQGVVSRSLMFPTIAVSSLFGSTTKLYVVSDQLIVEYDMQSFTSTFTFTSQVAIGSINVNQDLNVLYVYGVDGKVVEVDLKSSGTRIISNGIAGAVLGLVYSSRSKLLLVGRGKDVEVWDTVQRTHTLTVTVSSGDDVDRIALG